MQSHLSSPWNNAVGYLAMAFGEYVISTGSCFYWVHEDRVYLITNWHNLAGRNPLTGAFMSETGAVPDRIAFWAYRKLSEPDAQGYYEMRFEDLQVTLYEGDFSKPLWFEHPTFGRAVDIAALDITDVAKGCLIKGANTLESDAVLDGFASQDVFIVGFPFGLIANAPAPIWKRGTLALDPSFDADNLPKLLVDTATRKGMSGSVVIARHILVGSDYLKKDGSRSAQKLYSRLDTVLGVYSGRHYPDLEKAQLGIVWKRRTIEETVVGRKVAAL